MLKRKIKRGFILIGALLFLSGIISSLELMRLNGATTELLQASRGNIELSKDLLDIVQEQNTLLLVNITDSVNVDTREFIELQSTFSTTLVEIKESFKGNLKIAASISQIEKSALQYNEIVDAAVMDELVDMGWFVEVYRTTYNDLTASIKEFMIKNEDSIVESARNVESNAHRAAMVGIFALAAGMILVSLFYYFINMFYIKPVLSMERSLTQVLDKGLPFKVDVHSQDELSMLKEHIEVLIDKSKR